MSLAKTIEYIGLSGQVGRRISAYLTTLEASGREVEALYWLREAIISHWAMTSDDLLAEGGLDQQLPDQIPCQPEMPRRAIGPLKGPSLSEALAVSGPSSREHKVEAMLSHNGNLGERAESAELSAEAPHSDDLGNEEESNNSVQEEFDGMAAPPIEADCLSGNTEGMTTDSDCVNPSSWLDDEPLSVGMLDEHHGVEPLEDDHGVLSEQADEAGIAPEAQGHDSASEYLDDWLVAEERQQLVSMYDQVDLDDEDPESFSAEDDEHRPTGVMAQSPAATLLGVGISENSSNVEPGNRNNEEKVAPHTEKSARSKGDEPGFIHSRESVLDAVEAFKKRFSVTPTS